MVKFFRIDTYPRIKADLDMCSKDLITDHNDPIAPLLYGKKGI
jgi:hypothetical protein